MLKRDTSIFFPSLLVSCIAFVVPVSASSSADTGQVGVTAGQQSKVAIAETGTQDLQHTVDQKIVGKVSFSLGKAYLVHNDQTREPVTAGMSVAVTDRIETDSNAHVHVRFIDAALLSIRPLSSLEIVRYDYQPEAPEASVVKLNLIEGYTRAISGDAARSARQNFRMNTPVAAIGVRGTDFVVRADQRQSRALVNEGAIIIAPFSSNCLAEALGPCSTNSLEVAGGANQVVLVSVESDSPILLPVSGNNAVENLVSGQVALASTSVEPEKEERNDIYTESVSTRAFTENLASTRTVLAPVEKPPVEKPPVVVEPVVPVEPVRNFTPEVVVPETELKASQLVWGRWSEANISDELLTLPYQVAREGRQTTVGSDRYVLFRTEPGANVVKPGLGVVSFELLQAQAYYLADGGQSLMNVMGGELSIDFDTNRFATSLDLAHQAVGAITFTDQGRIFSGGYFHSRSNAQIMAGAVSLDGTEAGYFFEKTLENGLVQGLTLWGSSP